MRDVTINPWRVRRPSNKGYLSGDESDLEATEVPVSAGPFQGSHGGTTWGQEI